MSLIVPAGKMNIVWSPNPKKETPLVKVAKEEKEAGKIPGVPDGTGPHGMGPEFGRGKGPCGRGGDNSEESDPLFDAAKEFAEQAGQSDGVAEVKPITEEKKEEEGQSELKEAVEEVKGAVEKMEVAVDKVEDAEEAEIEVEVEESPEEVEVEIKDEVPGEEEVSGGEVIVTSDEEKCACAKDESKEIKEAAKKEKKKEKKEEKKEEKEAAVEEEFCRFGKLSPVNKKKIADYWVNALGYPKDYVNLMVKDYEK